MKIGYQLIILCVTILFFGVAANSQVLETKNISLERSYEVIIMQGSYADVFNGVPVNQLYLYAYSQNGATWKPITFQIDEMDPTYSDPPDKLLDDNDELLFLAQDLGDRVTLGNWIDDSDSKSYNRFEIEVVDSRDQTKKGWCYLYRSTTLTEQNKSDITYLSYDAAKDSLMGKYYHIGNGGQWFPQNILITAEGKGNGKDFYDRTKLRIRAIPLPLVEVFLNEDHFIIDSTLFLIEGPIRVQRRDSLILNIPDLPTQVSVKFTRKFYPYYTNFHGRVPLDLQNLFKIIRMSYDLNPDISDSKFYSGDSSGAKNSNITIDGNSDQSTIDLGLSNNTSNWTMATGQFGTMLTINDVYYEIDPANTESYIQSLYYWDDKTGTSLPISRDTDTGDGLSYGDHGMIFDSYSLGGVITYNSETFLLPANQTPDFAQTMFYNFNSPMIIHSLTQSYSTSVELTDDNNVPSNYRLRPNIPNPFNPTTNIIFDLPKDDFVTLQIYDLQGRQIITLVNSALKAGVHSYTWNGRNQNDNLVTTGIYLCTIHTSRFNASQKIVLIK